MKEEVKKFLESGLLEDYLMGTCDANEAKKVEHYLDKYPEVREEFDSLQENIEKVAQELAVNSPSGLKEAIISCLEDDTLYQVKTKLTKKRHRKMLFIPWAAAVIGITASISLFSQKQSLLKEKMELSAERNMLDSQLAEANDEVHFLQDKLALSGHSKTERLVLAGNKLVPEFQSTAFWNDTAEKAILYINDLGELDDQFTYQIWADVDGKMINAGLLPGDEGLVELKYLKNATSLNITIEPKGGSEHPNVEKLICSHNLLKL